MITREEKLRILEDWYVKFMNARELLNNYCDVLGVSPENLEPIYWIMDGYTSLVSEKIGDVTDILTWWIYDADFDGSLFIGVEETEVRVYNLSTLVDALEMI